MGKLAAFNHISLDGYFVDAHGDMSFAHSPRPDPEWDAFVAENAGGEGMLLFGRVTYELMASYWPTAEAAKAMPDIAERMNKMPKVVFSRTLEKANWENTKLVKSDLIRTTEELKQSNGGGITILGSGSVISQLTQRGVIDEYQFVVNPVVLGSGRTTFAGVRETVPLKLISSRAFGNGNVVLGYERIA